MMKPITSILAVSFIALSVFSASAQEAAQPSVPDPEMTSPQWEYGSDPLSELNLKSPFPPNSPADALWHRKAISLLIEEQKKAIQAERKSDNTPLYSDGQDSSGELTAEKNSHTEQPLSPVAQLNKFVGILADMSAAMKVCRPDEIPFIEECGNVILNHWTEYSGQSIIPAKGEKRDEIRKIIKENYRTAYELGLKEAQKASEEQCKNMIKEEQESFIWKSCGRHFQNRSTDDNEKPVFSE